MMDDLNTSFVCCISTLNRKIEFNKLLIDLGNEFGGISLNLPDVPWDPPLNYQREMKGRLKTNIIILEAALNLIGFVELKKYCIDYENNTSISKSRIFNLNPGYINLEGMYLATHKPSIKRGREYLMDGVWQEKQLYLVNNQYTLNINTFSEYNNLSRINVFDKLLKK